MEDLIEFIAIALATFLAYMFITTNFPLLDPKYYKLKKKPKYDKDLKEKILNNLELLEIYEKTYYNKEDVSYSDDINQVIFKLRNYYNKSSAFKKAKLMCDAFFQLDTIGYYKFIVYTDINMISPNKEAYIKLSYNYKRILSSEGKLFKLYEETLKMLEKLDYADFYHIFIKE